MIRVHQLVLVLAVSFLAAAGFAEEPEADSESDSTALAKQTQNPLADLISLPIQNNFTFGVGPDDGTSWVANIQPVYPMEIAQGWRWIHRPILPLVYQPSPAPGVGSAFGLGDIVYQGFLSPINDSPFIWGVGPVLGFPTGTDDILGTEKWSAGPGVVALWQQGPWTVGGLANNVWSFAGKSDREDVNFLTLQYFVNYNLGDGLYFTSAPINTADWEADSSERWTVPIGGGMGKVFKLGKLPLNVSLQAFWLAEAPTGRGDWQLRFQIQTLFPK